MKIEIKLNGVNYNWEINDNKYSAIAAMLDCLEEYNPPKKISLIDKVKAFFSRKKDDSDTTPLGIGA